MHRWKHILYIQLFVKQCLIPLPPATLLPLLLHLARCPHVKLQDDTAPDLLSWYQTQPLYPQSKLVKHFLLYNAQYTCRTTERILQFLVSCFSLYSKSLSNRLVSTLIIYVYMFSISPRFSPPLESLVDPLDIIERLHKEPELGFLYLTPRDDCKSCRYNPYNLRYIHIYTHAFSM